METLFTHKTMMRTALAVCLAGALAVSCSNDDNTAGTGGPAPADITANYSNKLAYGDRANLALTYSGDSLIGKDVTFKTDDSKTAELTLNNILPHENATPIKDVTLTPDGKGGYSFKGSSTSPLNTTFDYSGTITKGKLSLDINNAKVPGNGIGTLKLVPYQAQGYDGDIIILHTAFFMATDNAEINQVYGMMGNIIGDLLDDVLNTVTFQPDGNITASYYAGKIDVGSWMKNYMQNFQDSIQRVPSDWSESPKNLATYYLDGKNNMFVTPNVDMITRQIKKDNASRAGIMNYTDAYKQFTKWTTTGVQLSFEQNPYKDKPLILDTGDGQTMQIKYEGDYLVRISRDEIAAFMPLIQSMITPEMLQKASEMAGGMYSPDDLKKMIQELFNAKKLEIGLFFNKSL